MSLRVRHGGIYSTGRDYGQGTHSVNRTGRAVYLCDCCESRRQFATQEACDAHEDASAGLPVVTRNEYGTHNDMP